MLPCVHFTLLIHYKGHFTQWTKLTSTYVRLYVFLCHSADIDWTQNRALLSWYYYFEILAFIFIYWRAILLNSIQNCYQLFFALDTFGATSYVGHFNCTRITALTIPFILIYFRMYFTDINVADICIYDAVWKIWMQQICNTSLIWLLLCPDLVLFKNLL